MWINRAGFAVARWQSRVPRFPAHTHAYPLAQNWKRLAFPAETTSRVIKGHAEKQFTQQQVTQMHSRFHPYHGDAAEYPIHLTTDFRKLRVSISSDLVPWLVEHLPAAVSALV
jgi:hypothetical protein